MRALMILAAAGILAACGETASERQARDELERIAEERERERAAAEQEAAEHLMTFGLVGTEPDEAAASGPAADISAPGTPARAGVSDAERFVRWLYAGVASGEIELTSAQDASSVWTAANARQIEALSDADRAFLTGNPLCACRDASGVAIRSVEIIPAGDAAATARVALSGAGRAEVQLSLVRQADGWRLADVPGG